MLSCAARRRRRGARSVPRGYHGSGTDKGAVAHVTELASQRVRAAVGGGQPVPPRRQCSEMPRQIRSKDVGRQSYRWSRAPGSGPTPPCHTSSWAGCRQWERPSHDQLSPGSLTTLTVVTRRLPAYNCLASSLRWFRLRKRQQCCGYSEGTPRYSAGMLRPRSDSFSEVGGSVALPLRRRPAQCGRTMAGVSRHIA